MAVAPAIGSEALAESGKPTPGPQSPLVEPSTGLRSVVVDGYQAPAVSTNPRALRQAAAEQILGSGAKPTPPEVTPEVSLPAHGTITTAPASGRSAGHAVPGFTASALAPSTAHGSALGIPAPAAGSAAARAEFPSAFYSSTQVDQYNDTCISSGFGANETSVAQATDRPNLVVVAFQMYENSNGSCGDSHAFAGYSQDGGQHWAQVFIPNQVDPTSGDPGVVYDPVRHVFIFSHIEFTRGSPTQGRVATDVSSDGASWTTDTTIDSGTSFNCNTSEGVCVDKPMITVDQNSGSPHYGRVLVTWSEFHSDTGAGDLEIWDAFTDNGGASWTRSSDSVNIAGDCGNGSSPAFDAAGNVMVAWEEKNSLCGLSGGPALFEELSTNGGASWAQPSDTNITNINDIGFGGGCVLGNGGSNFRCNSFPSLAGDPNPSDSGSNAFIVVWADQSSGITDSRFSGTATVVELKSLSTANDGTNWDFFAWLSSVNFGDKFFPWLAFAPDGRIDVGFSDREDDATASNPNGKRYDEHGTEVGNLCRIRGGCGTEDFVTFTDDGTLGDPGTGQFIGDYAGITSQDLNFDTFPVWTDVRDNGIPHVRTMDVCYVDCYTFLAPYTPLFRGSSSFTDLYQFNTDPNFGGSGVDFWNAVGIREGADGTSVDDDTILYSNRYFNSELTFSNDSPPFNDYLLENDNFGHSPTGTYFPQVHSFLSQGGTYSLEWAAGHIVLDVGSLIDSMGSSNVVRIYDTSLSTGTTYFVGLRPVAGNTSNYSLTLHSASRGNQQGRSSAVSDSGPVAPGQPAFASYATGGDPNQFDAIVVINNNGGTGSYNLYEDTAAPSGTININSGATYTTTPNVTLTLAASNPTVDDPVSDMRFSNDGVNFGSWQAFATSASYTLPAGDGAKTVFVQFRNGAGAVSATASHSITLDTTPPTTTASLSNSTGCASNYFNPVQVALTATDATSGVASTVYQVDGGAVTTYSGPFNVSGLGAHTVTFHSTDHAGNVESAKTATFTIVAATLVDSPTSGTVASKVKASGSNYRNGETVKVFWDSTSTTAVGSGTAVSCAFSATFNVPQATLGTHHIISVGQTSLQSASVIFTVKSKATLAKASAPQGSADSLTGTGFGASEIVDVRWNSPSGTLLGSGTTNSVGTTPAIPFTVPVTPFANDKVYAVGRTTGATAFASFKVKPTLSIAPTSGKAGSNGTVSVTGFGASEMVTVKWNCATATCSSTTVLTTATTDANGNFSGKPVVIPPTATAGTYTIGGLGNTSHAFATTKFTVTTAADSVDGTSIDPSTSTDMTSVSPDDSAPDVDAAPTEDDTAP